MSAAADPHYGAGVDLFTRSWTALRTTVAEIAVGDCLGAYVLERTLHHLDLIAHLPDARTRPPNESPARSDALLERIAGAAFPPSFTDRNALLVGTGRSAPTDARRTELREVAVRSPLVLS
ncbi:hypothetical protein [Streptomyces sp. NPDC091682]|uniref:hypothetical protein n=1 Tax=unclassified Streptomyces TaxID=2593676 RepID=UPI0038267028